VVKNINCRSAKRQCCRHGGLPATAKPYAGLPDFFVMSCKSVAY